MKMNTNYFMEVLDENIISFNLNFSYFYNWLLLKFSFTIQGEGICLIVFLRLIVFLQLPLPGGPLSFFSVVSLVLRQSRRS